MNPDQNQQEALNQVQLAQQIEQLERVVKQHLSKEAITRYGTLKTAHPEKALQALMVLAQLIQAKRLTHKLSDEEFKSILVQFQAPKKEFKVIRK